MSGSLTSGAGLFNDGGLMQLTDPSQWPTSGSGLLPGDFYTISGAIYIVPGFPPGPFPKVLIDGSVSSLQLLGIGGANLPVTDPAFTGQYWSNGGLLCASLVTVPPPTVPPNFPQDFGPAAQGVVGMSAIGTTTMTATQIYAQYSVFTLVVAGGIAQLPSVSQVELTVLSRGSNDLTIVPDKGGQIDSFGVDASVSIPVGGNATFVCVDAPTPFAVPRQWRVL